MARVGAFFLCRTRHLSEILLDSIGNKALAPFYDASVYLKAYRTIKEREAASVVQRISTSMYDDERDAGGQSSAFRLKIAEAARANAVGLSVLRELYNQDRTKKENLTHEFHLLCFRYSRHKTLLTHLL